MAFKFLKFFNSFLVVVYSVFKSFLKFRMSSIWQLISRYLIEKTCSCVAEVPFQDL